MIDELVDVASAEKDKATQDFLWGCLLYTSEAARYGNYSVHYAVKANANPKVLAIIRENGLGADCVSGGEIRAAIM